MDPLLIPDLVSDLWLKDCICTIYPFYHLAKISKKFSTLLITYQDSVAARNPSASRSTLGVIRAQGEFLLYNTPPCRAAQEAMGSTIQGVEENDLESYMHTNKTSRSSFQTALGHHVALHAWRRRHCPTPKLSRMWQLVYSLMLNCRLPQQLYWFHSSY